jgi:hypothetical protein
MAAADTYHRPHLATPRCFNTMSASG